MDGKDVCRAPVRISAKSTLEFFLRTSRPILNDIIPPVERAMLWIDSMSSTNLEYEPNLRWSSPLVRTSSLGVRGSNPFWDAYICTTPPKWLLRTLQCCSIVRTYSGVDFIARKRAVLVDYTALRMFLSSKHTRKIGIPVMYLAPFANNNGDGGFSVPSLFRCKTFSLLYFSECVCERCSVSILIASLRINGKHESRFLNCWMAI